MVINAEKLEGETPLELIDRLRAEGRISQEEKATYAGRLDPMASGAMIILTGDDVHRKEEFMGLDKEYEVEILFGFATDSYDILGRVATVGRPTSSRTWMSDVQVALQSFVGKFTQEYPRYSSKVIAMSEVPDEMPTKEVEIYQIDYLGMYEVSGLELLARTQERIAKVKGDFRQREILDIWQKCFTGSHTTYMIVKFLCRCGSGTYMRSLAHELGKKLGVPALAYGINRTKFISS